ncbi:hypothetical protein DF185_09265 [Marinifilum breve]|uniref:Lipocalin-like domain-containing protein n=1 Tax=Marinifilum breve TaxID=2184082 RepID=A0A2V3ZZ00_9BACT|nr:hypothetical protein [Marinifilum breve]PXY01648.1 hypothetical protein DF185_09265 [Marinifilum breve]
MKKYTTILTNILTLLLCVSCGSDDAEFVRLEEIPQWNVNSAKYQSSMQVVCTVNSESLKIGDEENDMIGAFINGECRGIVIKPVSTEDNLQSLFYLVIMGNQDDEDEKVELKLFDFSQMRLELSDTNLVFKESKKVGSVSDPLKLNV